jgi:hypothetical protein
MTADRYPDPVLTTYRHARTGHSGPNRAAPGAH